MLAREDAMPNAIEARPLAGAVGAEIRAIDLRQLDDAATGAIRRALLAHGVVFFREQSLDDAALKAFAGVSGRPSFIRSSRRTALIPPSSRSAGSRATPVSSARSGTPTRQ
jgi:alpha-ketoglutarate-dependent taurine dioxygenase